MGRKRTVPGRCHLCGEESELTFEHTPGKGCFNNQRVHVTRGEDAFADAEDLDHLRYSIEQRGLGVHSLCGHCNNRTGGWYGDDFIGWTRQGARALAFTRGPGSTIAFPFQLRPLSVAKQALLLFVSTCGPHFLEAHEPLRRVLLNPEARGLPSYLHLYAYLVAERVRVTGVMARGNLRAGRARALAEFAFPPFGYVLSFDPEPPDSRLLDISSFANLSYRETVTWRLLLFELSIYTPFVGDYRDRQRVLRDAAAN